MRDANTESLRMIREYVNNLEISWLFSPPYGSHFGGLWEATVKSFKYHYKGYLEKNLVTFEEHTTLATNIESSRLNSRSMCSISVNSRDSVLLTSRYFLVGRSLRSLPPTTAETSTTKTYAQRWTLIVAMRNSFCATWKKEVLHQLIQTNKWKFPQRNLKVRDVVILYEENTPPTY